MEVAVSGKITGYFSHIQFHLLLLGSLASLWTWWYLVANVGTSKHAVGGDRVSTISILGCSTSMALAMGPTDEEEEASYLRFMYGERPGQSQRDLFA